MERIKVLWYTNTPCPASDKLGMNLHSGGWLRSLEDELHKVQEIELAICFYTYKNIQPFKFNCTQLKSIFKIQNT